MDLTRQRQLFLVVFIIVIGIFFATTGLQKESSVDTSQRVSEKVEMNKPKLAKID